MNLFWWLEFAELRTNLGSIREYPGMTGNGGPGKLGAALLDSTLSLKFTVGTRIPGAKLMLIPFVLSRCEWGGSVLSQSVRDHEAL